MDDRNHKLNSGARPPSKRRGTGALESAAQAETTGQRSSLEMKRLLHGHQIHQLELEMQNDELRRIQAELDTTRERYFDLYNLAPVGYFTLSRKMVILETNFTAANMLGTTRKELTLRSFFRFIVEEDQDHHYQHTKKLFETCEPQVCEVRMVKADETRFWVRLEASVVQGEEGVALARVVMSDITAKRHAEQTLRDWSDSLEQQVSERTEKLKLSEDRFRQLSQATFEGVAISENGILLDGNLRFAEIHGYRLKEMIGRPITDFVAPESRALVSSNSLGDFREAYEYFGLRKDGSIFPAEAHGRARLWQGRSTRVTALRDLTLAKQATAELQAKQSELERAQQLALVSEVSAGIVHQLAQPLSALGANVFTAISSLEQRALPASEMLEILYDLQDGVASMRDIVTHLRALTNPQPSGRVEIGVNAIIEEVLPLVRQKAESRRVRIEVDLDPELPPVQADFVQLSQVILNLSRNAVEACHDCHPERRIVAITTRAITGEGVELCVRDAGSGIAPEIKDRLFSPFFSTKPDGLGIGLRLSQTIVQSHGGRITCEDNAAGFGAVFRVVLPALPPSPQ